MKLDTLMDVLAVQLQDLYSAEQQITEALPKIIEKSHNTDLIEAFRKHLEETHNHINRLEEINGIINISMDGEMCEAMKGLLAEGEEILKMEGNADAKDAAIIAAAQKVEHYEIAGYGSSVTFAKELDLDDVTEILKQTLDEEGNADKKLTSVATGGFLRSGINQEAA